MADPPESGRNAWTVRNIVATMFPLLIVLSGLEMISGMVLESVEETYLTNPTLFVLVPVMIGMGGNLGSIFASRLSTRLHLGTLSFDLTDETLWTNVVAVVGLGTTIFVMLGLAAWVVGQVITDSPLPIVDLLQVSVISGLLLTGSAILLAIAATYVSFVRGYDPDDTTIPVVTNLCDILGVVILSAVAIAVL
ncbi:magnesium transporter [Haloparvum sp. PAK95]|uniref:magnesium transporter n=1 Tax=Haloparvum sp. PAK95 TaxID=3418962 RepID=UPI003D2EC9DD